MEDTDKTGEHKQLVKKTKAGKRFWVLIDIGITLIILSLFLYRPFSYHPSRANSPADSENYWAQVLLPEIYNGAQEQKPFTVTITDEQINKIVASSGWPKASEGFAFSSPQVRFVEDGIILMGTAAIEGIELIITVQGDCRINEAGLLSLNITSFKVGAVNITPLAKMIARKMYLQRLEAAGADSEDINLKVLDSLFKGESFEPVFKLEDKKIRMTKAQMTKGQAFLYFSPVRGEEKIGQKQKTVVEKTS